MYKKTYITPDLENVVIEAYKMVCASDGTSTDVTIPTEDSDRPDYELDD